MQESSTEYHLEKDDSISIVLAMIANSGEPVSPENAVKIGGGIQESVLQRIQQMNDSCVFSVDNKRS